MAWLGGSGEMVKQLDSRNVSKNTAEAATAEARTGIGSDGNDKMKSTAEAEDWLVIRRRQQRDNSNCGSNGGGTNLAWLGVSGKTLRWQQQWQEDGSNSVGRGANLA